MSLLATCHIASFLLIHHASSIPCNTTRPLLYLHNLNSTITPLGIRFMVVHLAVLMLLNRLATFCNAMMCLLRAITIIYPFRKMKAKFVAVVCLLYGATISALELVGFLSSNSVFIGVNYLLLDGESRDYFTSFNIIPFMMGVLITVASISISSVKLNLCYHRALHKNQYNRNREMTVTMLMVGLIFVTCKTFYLVFATYVLVDQSYQNFVSSLTRNVAFFLLAYYMCHGLTFVEAATTPIVLNLRGKQLREESRRRLVYMLRSVSRTSGNHLSSTTDGLSISLRVLDKGPEPRENVETTL